MSYLDEAAQDMAESFKRVFITAFGHGYDFGCESKEGECKRLEAENAKLRELCAGLLTGYECGYGELCKGCTWDGIGESKTFSCLPRAKARELGVEVTS